MVGQQVPSTSDQAKGIDGETGLIYALGSIAGFYRMLYYGLFYYPFIPW
jgi:hypothetical protein